MDLLGIGTHRGPPREYVAYTSVVPEEEKRVGVFHSRSYPSLVEADPEHKLHKTPSMLSV